MNHKLKIMFKMISIVSEDKVLLPIISPTLLRLFIVTFKLS